ncbi:MAG: methionyl-tRNA formyltransferase [bacterium]
MKIIFFGMPEGIVCLNALIGQNKNIIALVPPAPTHSMHNLMVQVAEQNKIPVLFFQKSPKEKDFIESLKEIKPDIGIVCAFDHLLPKEILEIPQLGFINYHPSLLPEYRGGNPYFHVILNDEKKTGVTIHYMDENFDTGDIIDQWETEISSLETLGTLLYRLNAQAAQMIINLIEKFEKGENIPRKPQVKTGNFKTSPVIYPEKGQISIDWSKDSSYIERFTRACNPIFGATTYFRNCMIKIWAGESLPDKNTKSLSESGTIVKVSDNSLEIATGNGLFCPTVIQIANFLVTDAKSFIKHTNPKTGEIFTEAQPFTYPL